MIALEDHGPVGVIRLNHGKANLLDLELLRRCEAFLSELEAAPPRAYVLTGTGRIFSAGVDLTRLLQGGRAYLDDFLPALTGALRALFAFSRPLVAAINGHAIAGGCLLAQCCEYRVMAVGGGRIGVPELRVGVAFPAAALEILRHAVGSRFEDLALGGGLHEAAEAQRLGLVHQVADDALAAALDVARDRASLAGEAYALTKLQGRLAVLEAMDRQDPALRDRVHALWAADETQAAIRAYVERTLRKG